MRKNTDISEELYSELITQFYKYFETGYAFEEFLKIYLEKLVLDEVFVTQRSRDGGIDLFWQYQLQPQVAQFVPRYSP